MKFQHSLVADIWSQTRGRVASIMRSCVQRTSNYAMLLTWTRAICH